MDKLFHSRFSVTYGTKKFPVPESGVAIGLVNRSGMNSPDTAATNKARTVYALSQAIGGFRRTPT